MTFKPENYRSSTEYREILRILQKAMTYEENILWQTTEAGKTVIPIQHLEIDFVSREVAITFDSGKHWIRGDQPLFVKLDYRVSVFKVTEFHQRLNTIYFPFPELIKTLEYRSQPRLGFSPLEEKSVGLKSSVNIHFKRDPGSELYVRAIDTSESGLGLVVSEQNRHFFKNNRILWVMSLDDQHLNNPILGEVMYMNSEVELKFQNRKQKLIKVGIKLSELFPEHIYQKFIKSPVRP